MNDLEFIISQYLDGTLQEADRKAMEVRLAEDVDARALLDEYRRLGAALKLLPLPPAVRWDHLAAQISSAVAARDELEFAVSNYASGTLEKVERRALEIRIAESDVARSLLAEHQALSGHLKNLPAMQPVHWQNFASHISRTINRQREPVSSYKLLEWRLSRKLALAASLFIATGVAISVYLRSPTATPRGPVASINPIAMRSVAEVSGPAAELADHPVTELAIGPPSAAAPGSIAYSDDLTSRPSRLIIASAAVPRADASLLPY